MTGFAAPTRAFRRWFRPAAALMLATPLAAAPARADVLVEGSEDAVRVEARDSSVADVLDALGASFDLRYPATADLDRRVSRTFRGSLSQVISGLLAKYDYVATKAPSGEIEIIWMKPSAQNAGSASPRWRRMLDERVARYDRAVRGAMDPRRP